MLMSSKSCMIPILYLTIDEILLLTINVPDMRFPTMWYVRPAKPQISLHIRAYLIRAFACRLNILWVLSYWLKFHRLHRLTWVYTYQNATLLEITCHCSNAASQALDGPAHLHSLNIPYMLTYMIMSRRGVVDKPLALYPGVSSSISKSSSLWDEIKTWPRLHLHMTLAVGGLFNSNTHAHIHMGLITRKPYFVACKWQRCRPACASAQTDQHLCCLLSRKYNKLAKCNISRF